MRILRGAVLAVSGLLVTVGLLSAPVLLPVAQAGVNVVICNAAVSEDGLKINVVSNYWQSGYPLLRGQCNTFNRSGLYVHLFTPVKSWKVRTNPGTYGSCQDKQFSTPGSSDRYEYQVFNNSGC